MGAILLAYEREQDLAAIETLLQSRGHHVTRARSGLEALEAARMEPPHAIVSDVQLPLLDGFALCRRLREDPVTRYLPVFLLSFRVEGPKYEAFAAEVGAQRFFPRGSTIEDLATALDGIKTGTDTMRIPALVPELLDRQEQDRRRVSELEKQVRELTYTNKLLAAAERSARAKAERAAVERVDAARADAGRADAIADERSRELEARIAELEGQVESGQARARELEARLGEHEARVQALAEAEAEARDAAAQETRAGHARVGVLEARLTELQSSRAQAQAQASDALRAFSALALPTLLHDMETHELRAASDSAAALLRLAPESFAGRPLAEVLPGMVAAEGASPPDEVEYTRPDGTLARFALRRASVSYAGRACWITTLIDVTADRAVADAERRARPRAAAIEAAPAPTCVLDADGTLLHANAAFRTLLLLEAGRTEGVALGQFLVDPADAAAVVTSTRPAQVRWKRADGSAFEAESMGAALAEPAGARVLTLRDLSELRATEQRVERELRRSAGLVELAQQVHMLTEVEVPARALGIAREVTGSGTGCVFLVTAEPGQLELAALEGPAVRGEPGTVSRWRGQAPTDTALWECATTLAPVERTGPENTAGLKQAGLPHGFARQLAVPILDGGRLAGVLLLADKPVAYDEDDRRHATAIADGLWKALRRRRSDAEVVSAMDHMERVMLGVIDAIGVLSEAQDGCKTGRARRVAELAAGIGSSMGLPGHSVRGLRVIGQLVDVGMLHIPREILWRPGPLVPTEFELVRTHPERGFETLRRIDFPWPVAEAVRQHHERLDGSGYPRGLKGDDILLEARIVAVADAVEAMLAPRPHRQALSVAACIEELQSHAGRRYDERAVKACVKILRERQPRAEPEARAGQRIA